MCDGFNDRPDAELKYYAIRSATPWLNKSAMIETNYTEIIGT